MTPQDDQQAARRFAIIQCVRIGGIALLLAGIAGLAEALAISREVAAVLVVAGALATFLAPTLLARRWSTRNRR